MNTNSSTGFQNLNCPMQDLMLNVEVIEARKLPKMDLIGKADPYCYVWLSSRPTNRKKTKTVKKTYTPVWNESYSFPVQDMAVDVLKVQMYDWDRTSKDDPISTLDVELKTLKIGEVKDEWFDMTPVKHVKKGGQIKLKLHLAPLSEPAFGRRSTGSLEAMVPLAAEEQDAAGRTPSQTDYPAPMQQAAPGQYLGPPPASYQPQSPQYPPHGYLQPPSSEYAPTAQQQPYAPPAQQQPYAQQPQAGFAQAPGQAPGYYMPPGNMPPPGSAPGQPMQRPAHGGMMQSPLYSQMFPRG